MAWTRLYLILVSLVFITSCSSMAIKVDSQPSGAEVYSQVGQNQKKLGVTPLSLAAEQIAGDNVHLVIQKPGFQQYSIILEKRTLKADAQVFARLTSGDSRGIASLGGGNTGEKVEKVSRTVASIQSQLLKKNFQSAESLAQSLVNEYPSFAVGWNLLGNAYYLQNRHSEALEAYYKASEIDPDNRETQNLIERIERRPARSER